MGLQILNKYIFITMIKKELLKSGKCNPCVFALIIGCVPLSHFKINSRFFCVF